MNYYRNTKKNRRSLNAKRTGFTLVEMMVGMFLFTSVVGSLSSSFLFLVRSSLSMADYVEMNQQVRKFNEYFSRDIRNAEDIFGYGSGSLVFPLPTGETVSYVYSSANGTVTRTLSSGGGSTVFLSNLDSFAFTYFQRDGISSVSSASDVERVQYNALARKSVINIDQGDRSVSASYLLRNRS